MTRLSLLLAISPLAFGQGMVESALITGQGAAAASKAAPIGANASKILGAASSTLSAVPKAVPVAAPRAAPLAKGKVALPVSDVVRTEEKRELPDISMLKIGMLRAEIETLAGKPSQMMSMPENGKLIERYKYMADGKELRLVLEDGKLTEIKP